jgi:sugar phosphate isomerase/epimerase
MATIGFNTRSLGEHRTAIEAVNFAAENAIHALELDGRWLWQDMLSRSDIRHLKTHGRDHDIRYSIHFIHAGVPATHDLEARTRHLADLESTIRFAEEIEASVVAVHVGQVEVPGVDPVQATEDLRRQSLDLAGQFFRTASRPAEDAGVVLALENLKHKPDDAVQTYGELVEIVQRSGSPAVGITLDTGHAELTDGIDAAFEAFGPYLRHLHVHDCVGGEDHHEVGTGTLDLGRYAKLLAGESLLILEVAKSASVALQKGEDPKGVVLRSIAAVKRMVGKLAG